jgi:hypothetical protein
VHFSSQREKIVGMHPQTFGVKNDHRVLLAGREGQAYGICPKKFG